jgi:hypothetical protein
MIWLGLAGWIVVMAVWIGHLQYRRRHRICSCEHRRGEVLSVDDRVGSAEYLVWVCADCPFQTPLGELQAIPGRDRFWYTRGADRWRAGALPDARPEALADAVPKPVRAGRERVGRH